MKSFAYTLLEDDREAIRLLTAHPCDKQDTIRVSLHDAILGREGYIALSYVWEKQYATHVIKLNDQTFRVRPSLYNFLSTAQDELCDTYIWVDAICINQEDGKEKNRQVPLIRQIFAGAVKVVCWSSACERADTPGRRLAGYVNHPDTRLEKLQGSVLLACLRLAEHEYWSRLWIIQGIQLARKAELWWGRKRIVLRMMSTFFEEMTMNGGASLYQRWSAVDATTQIEKLPFFDFFSGPVFWLNKDSETQTYICYDEGMLKSFTKVSCVPRLLKSEHETTF